MAKQIKEDLKEQTQAVRKKFKSLGAVKLTLLAVLAVGTVLSYVFYNYIFAENSVFTQDYGSKFLNDVMGMIPKLIRCWQIITITAIITTLILLVISKSFTKTQRSITVSRLVCNLIRWIVTIALVIVVLAVWGVDTTALITGAGVITLIVGLGMQSLISDVVAGLFIVFENEFNIGDIITVDGFRGEVISMGIRTTKLKAAGNVKIFNNSEIRGVLNQTVEPSTAKAFIDIEYGESLARIDGIIAEKLKDLKIEGIIGEIVYEGVNELGASGVTLLFTAKCYEGDIFAVQRAMNKQLKTMFDENGINIPFNQIVVHTEK
ncbi:MAG: mechanosensitive ion channel family protein [Clostridia bacterium]|nr:mechanosensitive ion channel family protein [Clostridia bacterium]